MCLYHTEASWNKLFLYLLSSETCLDILEFSEEVHTNVANLIAGLKNFIMKDEEKRDDNDQNACVELRNLEFTQNISIQSFTWSPGTDIGALLSKYVSSWIVNTHLLFIKYICDIFCYYLFISYRFFFVLLRQLVISRYWNLILKYILIDVELGRKRQCILTGHEIDFKT